eukprot:TRINITY_DN6141_c0_g1_i2.p1 TRINITY_DN6141_c0_g1~~TRINITY_DN6141_c0_g1_i2.p1  ORF type:complete len:215 (-),score=29.01 TRINITY_DN6141_c0_g1_i2:89-685(-)
MCIRDRFEGIRSTTKENQTRILIAVDNDLKECERTIKQMEINIAGLDRSAKPQYVDKLKQHKVTYDILKKEFLRVQDELSINIGREKLFQGGSQGNNNPFGSEAANIINQQNNKLVDAKRVAYETEDISIGVQKELNRNNETLNRALETNRRAQREIDASNSLLNTIWRRMMLNKLVLIGVTVFVCLIIFVILYVRFS